MCATARRVRILLTVLLVVAGARAGSSQDASPAPVADSAGYVLIVNAANPAAAISRQEAAVLFLEGLSRWRHGEDGNPVDQSLRSPVREAFSREVLGLSVAEVRRHWERKLLRTVRETPPPARATDEEVVAHVVKYKGGIGYVSASAALPPGVKPLRLR